MPRVGERNALDQDHVPLQMREQAIASPGSLGAGHRCEQLLTWGPRPSGWPLSTFLCGVRIGAINNKRNPVALVAFALPERCDQQCGVPKRCRGRLKRMNTS